MHVECGTMIFYVVVVFNDFLCPRVFFVPLVFLACRIFIANVLLFNDYVIQRSWNAGWMDESKLHSAHWKSVHRHVNHVHVSTCNELIL